MKANKLIKPNLLSWTVASILGCSSFALMAAEADTNAEESIEVIEVTGIRGSVVKAADIKATLMVL